jgi:hypothetical protein
LKRMMFWPLLKNNVLYHLNRINPPKGGGQAGKNK